MMPGPYSNDLRWNTICQELLFEILYAGQSRNISKFGTRLSLSLPFKFSENPVGK